MYTRRPRLGAQRRTPRALRALPQLRRTPDARGSARSAKRPRVRRSRTLHGLFGDVPNRSRLCPRPRPILPSMTDYRTTLNLPTTNFPMRAELPKREPARIGVVGANRHVPQAAGAEPRAGRNAVDPARRAAVRQRRPAHGPLPQPLPQGCVRQDRACSTGAGPISSRAGTCTGCRSNAKRLTHLGVDFHHDRSDRTARALQGASACTGSTGSATAMLRMGLFGHYERPYMTIAPEFEATIVDTLADLAEIGPAVQGSAVDAVVRHRRDGARRSRDRVQRSHVAVDLRALSRERRATRRSARALRRRRRRNAALDRHLDHDALDAARQRRHRASSRTPNTRSIGWAARTTCSPSISRRPCSPQFGPPHGPPTERGRVTGEELAGAARAPSVPRPRFRRGERPITSTR